MGSYMESLGEMSSTAKSAKYAADIVKAMAPPPVAIAGAGAEVAQPKEAKPSVGKAVMGLAPGLVGGGVGAVAWKKHRVLGFLSGHALASNAYPIFSGSAQQRRSAMYRLGIEGSGVAGALLLKKKMHPVLGWIVGIAASTTAAALVPDSPVKAELKKMMEMVK